MRSARGMMLAMRNVRFTTGRALMRRSRSSAHACSSGVPNSIVTNSRDMTGDVHAAHLRQLALVGARLVPARSPWKVSVSGS